MANPYGDLSNSGYATIQLKAFTGPVSSGYKVSKFLGQKETLVQTKMSPNSSVRFEGTNLHMDSNVFSLSLKAAKEYKGDKHEYRTNQNTVSKASVFQANTTT